MLPAKDLPFFSSAEVFRTLSDSGLKHLADSLLNDPIPTFSEVTSGRFFDELDPQDYETVRYGAADSDYALRLYHRFNGWFTQYLPKHKFIVEEIESPTAVYLGIMKHNGIPVDTTLMLRRKEEAEQKLQEIGTHIPDATTETKGLVKQAVSVTDAAGETVTSTEYNALLAALRSAGIIASNE